MSKSRTQPWTTAKRESVANYTRLTSASPVKNTPGWRRSLSAVARWLHIYLSMASFVIVLFFAVTGLTLNHADWFGDESVTTEYKGMVNPGWVNPTDTAAINKLGIVEHLRTAHSIKGPVSDFRIDDRACSVSFRGPGYSADAFVDRETGVYKLSETRMGVVAILNDLHKGRDTGSNWSWVIDGSAIFMTLISGTGLILLLFLKKRRVAGLVLLGLGSLLVYAIYALF
jgi:hypothetical protein